VAQKRIDEELERIGLGGKSKQAVRTLSGGNKRRVELARALLHEPKILLMDEPTVGLDHRSRQDILNSVEVLRRDRDLAVLWATHLVDEAKTANRVVILHNGKILSDGPINTLVKEQGTKDLSEAFLNLTADPDEEELA
jgi:ABC-2 type transport system ATP-binding protein